MDVCPLVPTPATITDAIMSLRKRLQSVFIQVLELPDSSDTSTLRYRETKNWDSVGHMRLVAAIETEFGIFMETEQILDLSNFEYAAQVLKSHGITD